MNFPEYLDKRRERVSDLIEPMGAGAKMANSMPLLIATLALPILFVCAEVVAMAIYETRPRGYKVELGE